MLKGVLFQDSKADSPERDSRDREEEKERSPPITGSFWVTVASSRAVVSSWGWNRVVPSGWSTGMIARL